MSRNRNNALVKKWLFYLLVKDTKAKVLFALSIAAGVIWWKQDFAHSFGMAFGILLAVSIVFSFLSFMLVGAYREGSAIKLYDKINYNAGLPSSYPAGRDLDKIHIQWRGWRVTGCTIQAAGTSNMARSATTWRDVKQSIKDILPLTGDTLYTVFSDHPKGVLTFFSVADDNPNAAKLSFDEELYALVYDALGSYSKPLPVVKNIERTTGQNGDYLLETLEINTVSSISSYDRSTFEGQIRSKYNDPNSLWGFQWGHQDVKVHRIVKGSVEEKQLTMFNAVSNLVSNSLRRAFIIAHKESYIFTPDMVNMNREATNITELSINFFDYDLSDDKRRGEFEQMTERGLRQLLNSHNWEFDWTIQISGNFLTVRNRDLV
ncbi:MAG: hypothetical protein H9W81_09840 [Enterococcus sp.]|nr:hypothetical protein [Enterococcus sp.]